MTKFKPVPEELRQRVIAAVSEAQTEGCVVAPWLPERQAVFAARLIRRWRTFNRRGVPPEDQARQVHDLARGLVEAFEDDPKLVGDAIRDYEFLARKVLIAITGSQERGLAP